MCFWIHIRSMGSNKLSWTEIMTSKTHPSLGHCAQLVASVTNRHLPVLSRLEPVQSARFGKERIVGFLNWRMDAQSVIYVWLPLPFWIGRKGTHRWDKPGKLAEARRGWDPPVSLFRKDGRVLNGPPWGQFIVSGVLGISSYTLILHRVCTPCTHLIFSNFFLTIIIV